MCTFGCLFIFLRKTDLFFCQGISNILTLTSAQNRMLRGSDGSTPLGKGRRIVVFLFEATECVRESASRTAAIGHCDSHASASAGFEAVGAKVKGPHRTFRSCVISTCHAEHSAVLLVLNILFVHHHTKNTLKSCFLLCCLGLHQTGISTKKRLRLICSPIYTQCVPPSRY